MSVEASSEVIYVPTDYPTIQEAVNHANSGDTIFVYNGTYYEHVVINRSVSLVGEDKDSTIIDGGGTGSVISVTANNVDINGFTIQNSGSTDPDTGIYIISSGNNISHNTITNNKNGIYLYNSSSNTVSNNNAHSNSWYGIYLYYSSNNTVSNNNAYSNYNDGVYLYYSSSNVIFGNNVSDNDCGIWIRQLSSSNVIFGNNVSDNDCGVYLYYSSSNMISNNNVSSNKDGIYLSYSSNNNIVYHNNFVNNIVQVRSDSVNVWDYGDEGNYWSDYAGQDLNGDGVGDNPYVIDVDNQDNYPLMGMFSVFTVSWQNEVYHVTTVCNSTISDFTFEVGSETGNKIIRFNVTGEDGTVGFCRIMTPAELMNYPYIVLVDEEEITLTLLDVSNGTHVHLYFTYIHSSHTITIISSKMLYLYNELLDKYTDLQIDFDDLNSTYHELLNNQSKLLDNYSQLLEKYSALNLTTQELLDNYDTLLGNYSQLLERYSILDASFQEWLLDYSELQTNYTSLLLEHAQNIRSLIYVFIATTAMFIIAAAYLSTYAHRKVSRS